MFPEATSCVHDIVSTVYTVNLGMAVGADLGHLARGPSMLFSFLHRKVTLSPSLQTVPFGRKSLHEAPPFPEGRVFTQHTWNSVRQVCPSFVNEFGQSFYQPGRGGMCFILGATGRRCIGSVAAINGLQPWPWGAPAAGPPRSPHAPSGQGAARVQFDVMLLLGTGVYCT